MFTDLGQSNMHILDVIYVLVVTEYTCLMIDEMSVTWFLLYVMELDVGSQVQMMLIKPNY